MYFEIPVEKLPLGTLSNRRRSRGRGQKDAVIGLLKFTQL